MITRVWVIFTLYITGNLVTSELMGDHVCEKEERYTVNVTKYVLRNVTIRSYEWCVQVPPRCSTYSIQQINDTKIEEEEKIRYVKTCCIGYYEVDDGTKCLPDICRSCENGHCDEYGACHCDIGFLGSYCDKECVGNTWGVNCRNECIDCDEGRCVMQPENCVCPPKSIRCDLICGEGHQNSECLKQCNCDTMHICDPFTSKCIRVKKNYTEYDYEDFSNYKLVKNKSQYPNKINYTNLDKSTPYESILSTTYKLPSQNTNITDTNHFTTMSMNEQPQIETSTQRKDQHVIEFQTTKVKIETSTVKDIIDEEFIESTVDKEIKMSEINENVKLQIAYEDKLVNATPIATSNVSGNETKESDMKETFEESSQRILIDSHLFVTIISGVLFTVLIILSAAVFYVLYKLKEKRKKYGNSKDDADEKKIRGSISSVSVTARSIFHTPLPDPPVFQNPAFVTPLELSKQRTFETHVICNMNFPKQAIDSQTKQELFYDHPPSTGYRPVTVMEPPRSTCSKSEFDPIYDEIPSNRRIVPVATPPPSYTSDESNTLYMNTK